MKKQYEVFFTYSQLSRAKTVIHAESQEEAEEIANEITADQITDFNPIDGDLIVESVSKIKKLSKKE